MLKARIEIGSSHELMKLRGGKARVYIVSEGHAYFHALENFFSKLQRYLVLVFPLGNRPYRNRLSVGKS